MTKIILSAFSDETGSSIKEQIEGLKRNEISYTELRSVSNKSVVNFTTEQSKEYAKTLSEEGIKVWSIGSALGKVDISVNFEEYKDIVKKICETAKIFGTDKIRMFSFYNAYEKKELVMEYLQEMVEIAKTYDVALYHENEKDIYGDVCERVEEIMSKVDGLKFVYDPANFLQVGEEAQKTLPRLHHKTDYFHIKDVIFKTGELVPAGFGDGDLDGLVKRIQKDTTLTIEPHLSSFDAYKSIDNTEMKHKFKFTTKEEAFDCAVRSIKEIILNNGYVYKNGEYVK